MDTPVKSHTTPLSSQFEDSPVFNYISNLSPIEPVKSGHNNQTFNSLNFASPPSVFTSPHVSSSSVTRFSLKRHSFSDPLKLECSESENGQTTEGVSLAIQSEKSAYFDSGNSTEEGTTTEASTGNLELAVELPNTLKYDSGSPDCNSGPSAAIETDVLIEMNDAGGSHDADEPNEGHLFEREKDLRKICRVEQSDEEGGSNWVKLISDSNNVFTFDSPISRGHTEVQELRTVDSGTVSFVSNFLDENPNNLGKEECVPDSGSCEQFVARESNVQPEGVVSARETDQTPALLSSTLLDKLVVSDSCELVDDKSNKYINSSCKDQPSSQLHRTVRRRSLVFERAENHKRQVQSVCESEDSSLVAIQSNDKVVSANDKLVQIKSGSGYSLSKLPGIGLHLNALASNKGGKAKNETEDLEGQLINTPRIIKPCTSLTQTEAPADDGSSQHPLEGALVLWSDEAQVVENSYQTSCLIGEEFDPSSPKNKRRKSEPVGESLACKRCNCKRSKCLKLYCECFAAGLYCVEPCSCQECLNKPIHESIVLETRKQIESRNPLAFAPKVIRSVDAVSEFGEESNATPASARHKRGCNCRKSGCLKKYCECYQGGVGCSINCRCFGCKNTFGQKDGSEEIEYRESKLETYENNTATDASLEIIEDHQYHPITPSEIGRPLNQRAVNFTRKPRMPSLQPHVGPSNQVVNRENPNPEKVNYGYESSQLQMIPEDGTLEATMESNGCPQTNSIKSTSPNSKRVSPPYREFGSLTARRSGRKLILKSIPAFPQLSSHNEHDF